MMKILCVQGSARLEGNTAHLTDAAVIALQALDADITVVDLPALDIAGCTGCRQCLENQNRGCCALEDDMTPLYDTVREADGLIIASPVYMWGPTAYAKAFLDRLFSLCETGAMEGKRLTFISTAGDDPFGGMDLLAASLQRLAAYCRMEWVAPLYRAPGDDWRGWDEDELAQDAEEFAQRMVDT